MTNMWRLTLLFASLFVCVFSQTVDPSKSYIYGPGTAKAQAGISAYFFIQPVDANGKNVTTCPINLFRIVLSRKDSTTPVNGAVVSCDQTSGALKASYVVRIATQWSLNVTFQDRLVSNNSVLVTVEAGAISGPNCPASGSGLQGGVVGVPHYFNVTAYDAYDNRNYSCLAGNDAWSIVVSGGPSKTYQGSLSSCSNGIYTLKYQANFSGAYDIYVAVFQNPTIDQPYPIILTPGPIDGAHSSVSGPGLTSAVAGQNANFQITSRDEFNNNIETCINQSSYNDFEVKLTRGSVVVEGTVTSCSGGVYSGFYNATVAGQYSLSITYKGVALQGSPFTPLVSPGDIAGGKSIIQGPGLSNATAGVPALFIVLPFDAFGNRIQSCNARFSDFQTTLHYLNGTGTKYDVTGRVTGCLQPFWNYTIQYTATKRGYYSLDVKYKGFLLDKSPYIPFVESGALSPPDTNATGAIASAQVGVQEIVIIHAFDSYGNKIYRCDTDYSKWTVTLNNNIIGVVTACNRGNYTAQYEVTKIGNYILDIQFNDNPIAGSPFVLSALPGPPDPANCVMTGEGLSLAYAGVKANFSVACSDKYKNPITECSSVNTWNYTLVGPAVYTGHASSCNNQNQGAAVYYFEYTPFISGRYILHVTFVNITLPDNNVKVLPGPFYAPNSYAVGPGVSFDPSNIAGSPVSFQIIGRDKYNNTLDSFCPPDKWTITLTPGVTVAPVVSCTSNFQIIVTYTANTARIYTVDIKYDGQPIQKNPYQAQIFAGPIDPSRSQAQGQGLTFAIAGEEAYFNVVTFDKYDNAIQTCGSLADFNAVLSGPKISNLDDGLFFNCSRGIYYGRYYATKAGNYSLYLTYKNTPIDKSPYSPVVVAGDIYGPNCIPSGPGLEAPAGVLTYVTFYCSDKFENPINECRNDTIKNNYWKQNTSGGDFHFEPVVCYPGGHYDFQFYATKVGVWDLTVTYKNQSTHGSPLQVTIVAGPIDPPTTNATAGVTNARVGETTTIQVRGMDKYGNVNGTCFSANHWQVAFRDNTSVSYVNCANNYWYWQYTPTKIGRKVLDINFTDTNLPRRPIKNSPFTVNVIAGPIAANNTFAVGQGLTTATAGEVAIFYVYVVDAYGNNITVCEDLSQWSITLVGSDNPPVNFTCDNRPPYVGKYVAYKKGPHTLSIKHSGSHIHGSPFLPVVVPGPIYNGTSYAEGPATTTGAVGVRETFEIVSVDRYNNLIDTCDNSTFGKWGVKLVHKGDNKTFTGGVDGCSAGRYNAYYQTTVAGAYRLYVSYNQDNTLYSPFDLLISAGAVNASKSIAFGPGVNGTVDIIAGTSTHFYIKTFDSYNNPVETCLSNYRSYWNITLHLSNNATQEVTVQSCNNGVYDVYYNVTLAGKLIIYVQGNGVPTIGSPYTVNVIAGEVDPLKSLIQTPVPSGEAGETLVLNLELYDLFGNRVTKCSLNKTDFNVFFTGSSGNHPFNITDCKNGVYSVDFVLYAPGTYNAHAQYKNQEIKNSPQQVTISEGGVSAKYSYADGQGVYAQDIVAGTLATFKIHSVNQYNITLRSDAACVNYSFWSFSSDPAPVDGFKIVSCSLGVYTVTYNATKAAVYSIDIKLNDTSIAYTPYKPQVISGPPYPPNTIVTGGDVNKPSAKDEGVFTIQVRDVYDNDVTDTSKYDFHAVLTPACVNASVTCANEQNGRYNCTYKVDDGGIYCIGVAYNGQIIILKDDYRLNVVGGKGCADSCNFNGICMQGKCYCNPDYTTNNCAKKLHSKYLALGAAIGIIIGVGIFLFIVGILIGVFVIRRLRRGEDNRPLLA